MKWSLPVVLTLGMALLIGCDNKGSQGGPGATGKSPVVGQSDDAFSLSMSGVTLKQGEAKDEEIKIKRGKNFDQDVTVKFEGLPSGVTVDPASPQIKKGDDKVKVTVKAADDAGLGDHTTKVVGHPATGKDSVEEIKVKVDKK